MAEQLELLSQEEIERAMFALESAGQFTADRLHEQRPVVYKAVVGLLAQNWSIRRIKALLGVHHYTIAAVREREAGSIDTQKLAIGERALSAARLAVDSLVEALEDPESAEKISARDRALSAAILVDKAQLLLGGATSRVEHVESVPDIEEYQRWLKTIPVEMGLGEGKAGQKAEATPPAPRALPAGATERATDATVGATEQGSTAGPVGGSVAGPGDQAGDGSQGSPATSI